MQGLGVFGTFFYSYHYLAHLGPYTDGFLRIPYMDLVLYCAIISKVEVRTVLICTGLVPGFFSSFSKYPNS